MWIIQNIEPTYFNVLSDLAGQLTTQLLVFVLGFAYPYLLWESVKRGGGIPLYDVVSPPNSLWEALTRLYRQVTGGSWTCYGYLLLWTIIVMLVATFSHPAADLYLDFVSVQVGLEDSFFLGPNVTDDLPTYGLLGDKEVITTSSPALPAALLLKEADDIALGLSRFSIFPPDTLKYTGFLESSGTWTVAQSDLVPFRKNSTAKQIPTHELQVQCQAPTEQKVEESRAIYGPGGEVLTNKTMTSMPDCAFEAAVTDVSLEEKTKSQEWAVLDWTIFIAGVESATTDLSVSPLGVQSPDGTWQNWIEFSRNETLSPLSRGVDWKYGKRIRDGFTVGFGLNATGSLIPQGIELQVEYSVLTGPDRFEEAGSNDYYSISSWSRQCPYIDSHNTLKVADFLSVSQENVEAHVNASAASGCLIDVGLRCVDFAEYQGDELPWCNLQSVSATLLSGLEVEPLMLAAYGGIASRNDALHPRTRLNHVNLALNSIAAAFVLTREIVPGKVSVEDVRASINAAFLCLLLLPVIFTLPILLCSRNWKWSERPPPVPRSAWDLLVLGRSEEECVPVNPVHVDGSYPERPRKELYFGIQATAVDDELEGTVELKVGLGESPIPLASPGPTHHFPSENKTVKHHNKEATDWNRGDIEQPLGESRERSSVKKDPSGRLYGKP
ncbi:expressed unknown protein [Seminavis robusta]|uniref:Uncharacterized protein n=1 Tax=Seminavis robusta TaxID=568900 RepID=A0A9N8DLR4_9STRA|nr:expressed unknown protein [Seminavis robusta]|eukprot:Sro195_g083300.1 n/a (668) ;mRNA; r:77653-79747